jgi:N-carbamoylputrescine amidase
MLPLLAVMMGLAAGPHTVRVAVCQILVIDGDREGNFRRIEYALEQARAGHAQIAAFPESAILGWENPDAHRLATPIPGADSERIAALARKYGVMISIGLDEKDGGRLYDSAILVDRSGKLLWKHRKLNVLPELMNPPYAVGNASDIGLVGTEHGRIGVVICADTFSDEYCERIKRMKPDMLLVPYGWAAEIGEWPGHSKELEQLVSRRANGIGCPIIGTDLVGVMSQGPWRGRTYGGASVVANATGEIVCRLRDRDVEVRVVELPVGNLGR